MEIYIKIGETDWVHSDEWCGFYLVNRFQDDEGRILATAFWSRKTAKRYALEGRRLANFDGLGDSKASFWRLSNGKLVKANIEERRAHNDS